MKHHETMGMRNFIWITLSWAEKLRTERLQLVGKFSKDLWLITHLVPCKGTQHRWIIGKLVNDEIMCGVQNPGGEVRSGGVDCRCDERSDERIARC